MSEQLQKLKESFPASDLCNLAGVVLRCVFFNHIPLQERLGADLYRETVKMMSEVLGTNMQEVNTAVFETFKEIEHPKKHDKPDNFFDLIEEKRNESV